MKCPFCHVRLLEWYGESSGLNALLAEAYATGHAEGMADGLVLGAEAAVRGVVEWVNGARDEIDRHRREWNMRAVATPIEDSQSLMLGHVLAKLRDLGLTK